MYQYVLAAWITVDTKIRNQLLLLSYMFHCETMLGNKSGNDAHMYIIYIYIYAYHYTCISHENDIHMYIV